MAKGDTPTHPAVNDHRAAVQTAHTLLIVDDEPSLRFTIGEWARDSGLAALEAADGRGALEQLREHGADVVLLDLKLGDEDGLQVLRRLREEDATLPVIMLTGHGGVEHAVRATRLGAYDFIEKKPPYLEHLEVVVRRALEHARLKHEVEHLRTGTQRDQVLFGESAGLRRVLQRLEKVARSNTATVLLHGETGSGKELMARYVHEHSARAAGAFVDLNCSAIPEHLLESQLFGHEKGAFTDAKHFKKGLFDLADSGTLFLDEIGEMPMQLQSKLLRVLESRTFRRVGGQVDITVDVRVVAATHRDLPRAVADGRFREDLYYRLNVVPISMPPLRDRSEDIPLLAEHFIRRFCGELGRPAPRLHPDALKAMVEYAWPGNVRELKNVIERVVLLEAEEEIRIEHLPAELTRRPDSGGEAAPTPFPPGMVRPLAEVEMLAIQHALGVCSGNKTRAAQLLGISRQTLRTKLKEFAMEDDAEEVEPAS
jgi:two-component system, NtrC family, response regulator AtoC